MYSDPWLCKREGIWLKCFKFTCESTYTYLTLVCVCLRILIDVKRVMEIYIFRICYVITHQKHTSSSRALYRKRPWDAAGYVTRKLERVLCGFICVVSWE